MVFISFIYVQFCTFTMDKSEKTKKTLFCIEKTRSLYFCFKFNYYNIIQIDSPFSI